MLGEGGCQVMALGEFGEVVRGYMSLYEIYRFLSLGVDFRMQFGEDLLGVGRFDSVIFEYST